jgi:hypothetical protein
MSDAIAPAHSSVSLEASSSSELDALLARWRFRLASSNQELERAPVLPQLAVHRANEGPRETPPTKPHDDVTIRGSLAFFGEDRSPVVLFSAGSRWAHRGTMGVRGPFAIDLSGFGLSEAQQRALEFVAAWFGAPYDAVNLRPGRLLSWGFWHLSGAEMAEALAVYQRRSPKAFAVRVGRYGLAPEMNQRAGSTLGRPLELTLARGSARPLRRSRAEAAVASDARLVAVLARAGQDEEAQHAQMEVVVRRYVIPSLARSVQGHAGTPPARLGDFLLAARHIACALLLSLSGGLARLSELALALKGLDRRWPMEDRVAAADARLRAMLETMERAERAAELGRLWRTLESPELTAGALGSRSRVIAR